MNRVKVAIAGLGVAGVVGGGLIVPAIAAEGPPADAPAAVAERHEERQQKFAELLAKELGLDTAKVQAAVEKVREQMRADAKEDRLAAMKERLDAAVKEGKLTQEEADAILKAAENGVFADLRGPRHFKHHGPRGFGPGGY